MRTELIYRLHYTKLFGSYIEPEENAFGDIQLACMMSECQKSSPEKIQVYASDTSGGLDFPDFYYDDAVPLFSERVYRAMNENSVDNLFVKKVTLTDRIQKKSCMYIMDVPPCIDAVDYSLSGTECIKDGYSPLYDVPTKASNTIVVEYIDNFRITVRISDMTNFVGSKTQFGNSYVGLGIIKWNE